jgi:anti-sigma-K factor RskA
MFWAQATNTWTLFAHNLPALASGRTYQLWLITRDNQRISAGTFAPNQSGDAAVSAQYPLAADALQMIAVTEEPAGGVPQPTGEVVIAGQPR